MQQQGKGHSFNLSKNLLCIFWIYLNKGEKKTLNQDKGGAEFVIPMAVMYWYDFSFNNPHGETIPLCSLPLPGKEPETMPWED